MPSTHCPKCQGTLEKVVYANWEVQRCTDCYGIWFTDLEADRLKEIPGSETIDIGDPSIGDRFDQKRNINCPICETHLTPMVYLLSHSHIFFEKCPDCHGLWFDAGEFTNYKQDTDAEELDEMEFLRIMFG